MPGTLAQSLKPKRVKGSSKEPDKPSSESVTIPDDEPRAEDESRDLVILDEPSGSTNIVAPDNGNKVISTVTAETTVVKAPVGGPSKEIPGLAVIEAHLHPEKEQNKPSAITEAPVASTLSITSTTNMLPALPKEGKQSGNRVVDGTIQDGNLSDNSGHMDLNRHIYVLCGPGVSVGSDISPALHPVERPDCGYHAWPLYNNFKEISKEFNTWPPANVNLQDWHVREILNAGVASHTCHQYWPADFTNTGKPHVARKPKGRAAKDMSNGRFYYVVVIGNYQLSGDEGSQAVTQVPELLETKGRNGRKLFSLGQECIVQEDFVPTPDELKHGVLVERVLGGLAGLRPLNNRDDWGPEVRKAYRPTARRGRKIAGNARSTESEAGQAEELDDDTRPTTASASQKRSLGEAPVVARKATKTAASDSPSGSADKASTKVPANKATSGTKGKGRAVEKAKVDEMDGCVMVRPGIFNSTPRTQQGLVLAPQNLQETGQYFSDLFRQTQQYVDVACNSGNHDIAVSSLLALKSLLKSGGMASEEHFKKGYAEAYESENRFSMLR